VRKILIANRGEIAVRVARACKDAGYASVAVYAEPDLDALHVRVADEAYALGGSTPGDSYLRIDKILDVNAKSGADAVHPGYGFLSENADFAQAVIDAGVTWIGPSPDAISRLGDKTAARHIALAVGAPLAPGTADPVSGVDEVVAFAEEYGLPVTIKAAFGGGGRGMKVAHVPEDLAMAIATARAESKAAFNDDAIYLEKHLARPRHIEIQVLGDGRGHAIHLGERDCSLQRRYQKVWEEGPCPALNEAARSAIGETVAKAMREFQYLGVGTVEFLYEDGKFNFIEMNTRIQVEHPVTEMITDIDLVIEQIRVAAGNALELTQQDIKFHGHAIECRINAENPVSFRPSPGKIVHYHPPGGLGVRVDSAVYHGYTIPPYYDSLVGKLIVHGKTRGECLMRLKRALDEFVIDGIETTLPLFRALVREKDIIDGDYHIRWLEEFLARGGMDE